MTVIVVSLAVLFASFAMGLTGFGFGLIAMGLLPYVVTVVQANAIVLVLALVVCVAGVVPILRQVRLDVLWPVYVGALIGVPVGVFYLVELNETILRVSLGIVILIAVAGTVYTSRINRSAATSKKLRGWKERAAGFGVGVLSGAMGGAFSVGGPPIVLYLNSVITEKTEIKASLFAFFLFNMAARTPLFLAGGIVTRESLVISAAGLPALAVGLVVGTLLHDRLETKMVRRIIQLLLVASAGLLIVNSV